MGAVEDFQQTLNRQLAAGDTLYLGDPGAWMALWSRRDPVSLFGAWGPCKTGWTSSAAPSTGWRAASRRPVTPASTLKSPRSAETSPTRWATSGPRCRSMAGRCARGRCGSPTSTAVRTASGNSSTATATSPQKIKAQPGNDAGTSRQPEEPACTSGLRASAAARPPWRCRSLPNAADHARPAAQRRDRTAQRAGAVARVVEVGPTRGRW